MASTSWKAFNFFTVSQVKPPEDVDNVPVIFTGADVSSTTSGSDNLFVGDYSGNVTILNSAFKQLRTFPVNGTGKPVTKLAQFEGTSNLLTISEDLLNEPELKVWALDKTEKKTKLPLCLSSLTVHNGKKQFPVSAMAAMDDLSLVAVGFANGSITLIKGDFIHDRGIYQRTVFTSEEPITNLAFSSPEERVKTGQVILFVSTTNRVLTLIAAGRGHGGPARVLDSNQGCAVGCMAPLHVEGTTSVGAMGEEGGDGVVVVRDNAIYYYSPIGQGGCYAHEGQKQMVYIFKNYICLVQQPIAPTSTNQGKAASTFKRLIGSTAGSHANLEVTRITILDTDLKFVACQEAISSGIKSVFSEWGDLFFVGTDGKVWRYREKDLSQKLEILFQRNIFQLAINLAQRTKVDEPRLKSIYKRYADYLYGRSEWDNSMEWYIKSIGEESANEVSGVIRKFLDTQRISNLIEYLEALHRQHLAGSEHTTLLLNCYAKTRDVEKLDRFIRENLEQGAGSNHASSTLDVDTAINMCRQAGYFEQAIYLAERAGEDEIVVGLLGEELGKWEIAMQYLRRLDAEKAHRNLMKYAKALLEHIPKETTELLIEYFSGRYRPMTAIAQTSEEVGESNHRISNSRGHHASQPSGSVGNIVSGINSGISAIGGGITQLGGGVVTYVSFLTTQLPYVGGSSNLNTERQAPKVTIKFEPGEFVQYNPPQPRSAFSSFVDYPNEFIEFLEALLRNGQNADGTLSESDRIDIYTTLFEMYLLRASECRRDGDMDGQKMWEDKAKDIIQSRETLIDTSNVLLLSHLSNFRSGTVLVREKQGLVFDIFRSCTSAGDTKGALDALRKYGEEEPQLYPAALAYIISNPKVLKEAGEDELKYILDVIDEQGLMKPLQVVQTLSSSAIATVGMIKKYLNEVIEKERREIRNNRSLIEQLRSDTLKRKEEIEALGSKPVDFQATRCSSCSAALELPTVHFLCKHSFHQRCLNLPMEGEDEKLECPMCANDNRTIRALVQSAEEWSDKHEVFKDALAQSKDGFATVSDFIGRGVMGGPALMGSL